MTRKARIALTLDTIALTIFGVGVVYSLVALVMGLVMHHRWGLNYVIPLVCCAYMSMVMSQSIGRRVKSRSIKLADK